MYKPHKVKRKLRIEAEQQACLKEAQASRLAIANLKKEIASSPQSSSFIIEETCTETTVENFIPHVDRPNFVELDYDSLENQVFLNPPTFRQDAGKSNVIQLTLPSNGQVLTTDKIKNILGNDSNSNVEIMFKTSEGNYVTLTDEVLQNFQKDGLQYQVIDEEGRMGELQELQLIGKEMVKPPETSVPKEQNCLMSPTSFFSNNDLLFGNEPIDMTMVNPKIVGGTPVNHLIQKDMEVFSLNGLDVKPQFMTQGINDVDSKFGNVDDFYGMEDHTNESEILDTKEEIVVMDTCTGVNMCNEDSQKSESLSDMFFTDVSTVADKESNELIIEPDSKIICLDRVV